MIYLIYILKIDTKLSISIYSELFFHSKCEPSLVIAFFRNVSRILEQRVFLWAAIYWSLYREFVNILSW